MAGYNVTSIEEFAYDFTKIIKGEGKGYCKGKGTIPEPTEAQIKDFIRSNAEDVVGATDGKLSVQDLMNDPQRAVDMAASQVGNRENVEKRIAKLTHNSPSAEELKELPYRHIRGFADWLTNEILNPTASNTGIGL